MEQEEATFMIHGDGRAPSLPPSEVGRGGGGEWYGGVGGTNGGKGTGGRKNLKRSI